MKFFVAEWDMIPGKHLGIYSFQLPLTQRKKNTVIVAFIRKKSVWAILFSTRRHKTIKFIDFKHSCGNEYLLCTKLRSWNIVHKAHLKKKAGKVYTFEDERYL